MTYTQKMYDALKRDTKNKKNNITDLLDEIDRLGYANKKFIAEIENLNTEITRLIGIIESLCCELGRENCEKLKEAK